MKIGFFRPNFRSPPKDICTQSDNRIYRYGLRRGDCRFTRGDLENTHASFNTYRLGEKTRWLLNEPEKQTGETEI